jgi:hypothetical protein
MSYAARIHRPPRQGIVPDFRALYYFAIVRAISTVNILLFVRKSPSETIPSQNGIGSRQYCASAE